MEYDSFTRTTPYETLSITIKSRNKYLLKPVAIPFSPVYLCVLAAAAKSAQISGKKGPRTQRGRNKLKLMTPAASCLSLILAKMLLYMSHAHAALK